MRAPRTAQKLHQLLEWNTVVFHGGPGLRDITLRPLLAAILLSPLAGIAGPRGQTSIGRGRFTALLWVLPLALQNNIPVGTPAFTGQLV